MATAHYEAMLVDLRIGCWTARKQDKKVSREVATNHGTADHVGSYYKSLIDSPELTNISRIVSATRTTHYTWTLPWLDSGPRVLAATAHMDYMQAIATHKAEYEQAVKDFLVVYDTCKLNAQTTLGTLFNDADYPPASVVADKFAFKMHILPLPAGSDFRCDIGSQEVERIRDEITRTTNEAMGAAVASVYSRIADVVGAFVDRLDGSGKVFRDSLVTNARDLVAVLPKLNITNDPGIDDLCDKIKAALCTFEPDELRKNEALRGMVKTRADAVQDALADYMRAAYGK